MTPLFFELIFHLVPHRVNSVIILVSPTRVTTPMIVEVAALERKDKESTVLKSGILTEGQNVHVLYRETLKWVKRTIYKQSKQ